jgi:DNA gyrase inhibitor GyrI
MGPQDIRIRQLPPMRVAMLVGVGANPERDGWGRLLRWVECNQLDYPTGVVRFFGQTVWRAAHRYGYAVMMTVSDDVQSNESIVVKQLPGGLYAATWVYGAHNRSNCWLGLDRWLQDSRYYQLGTHPILEEHVRFIGVPDANREFEIYLPIVRVPQPASV